MVLGQAEPCSGQLVWASPIGRLRRPECGWCFWRDDRQPPGAQAAGPMAFVVVGGLSRGDWTARSILVEANQQTNAHLGDVPGLRGHLLVIDLLHRLPTPRR